MTNENLEMIKNIAIQWLHQDVKGDTSSGIYAMMGMGAVIHPVFERNPFIQTKDGKMQAYDILNDRKALKKAIAIKKSQIRDCNTVKKLMFVIRKAYRLKFLKTIKEYLDKKEFSELLGEIWIDVENPNEDDIGIETFLEWFSEADKESLMSDEEWNTYNSLPDEVRVYRGVGEQGNPKGLSWTLNEEKAQWFADRFQMLGGEGYVLTAMARKSDMLAYFSRREEDEVIIDGRKLDVERI